MRNAKPIVSFDSGKLKPASAVDRYGHHDGSKVPNEKKKAKARAKRKATKR